MERKTFQVQMERMQGTWGAQHYREERAALLWRAFQGVSDGAFTAAVDRLIANSRAAPMLQDIEKAVQQAQLEETQQRNRDAGGIYGVVQEAALANHTADKEFVKACVGHLRKKLTGGLKPGQFEEGCQALDTVAKQLTPRAPRGGAQAPGNWRRSPVGEE